jgi:hypothetical protein
MKVIYKKTEIVIGEFVRRSASENGIVNSLLDLVKVIGVGLT